MKGWLKRWILNAVAIVLAAAIIKGFEVTILGAVFGALALGIVNAFIRPVVILVTLPVNIITLGLFTLVINGLMLWLVASVISGFTVHGFGVAIISALLISVFSFLISLVIKD